MATEPMTYIPMYAALITGVFSFAGAWLATKVSKDNDRKHDARQLAKSFKGELSAILHILQLRDYQKGIRATAARCIDSKEVLVFSVVARQEYLAVYKANASKLGSLPEPLPETIAIIYTQASAMLEDFATLAEINAGTRTKAILGTPESAASRFILLADHIDSLMSQIKLAISQIDAVFPATQSGKTLES
jgi:hypothetical protein